MTWKMSASKNKKKFIGFKNYESFLKYQDKQDENSLIFVDVNLGNGIKGEVIAKKLYESGFKKLYLATGYDANQFSKMYFIQGIIGKEAPANIG
jgi:hypothetical protein